MVNNILTENCFDEFRDIPQNKKDPTIQVLYEYEKHYLEMVRKYSNEIEFIENMLSQFRKEQQTFYDQVLPKVLEKMQNDEGIDDETKKNWLRRLSDNMERSFNMSENLINEYATKSLDEFKQAVNERIHSI